VKAICLITVLYFAVSSICCNSGENVQVSTDSVNVSFTAITKGYNCSLITHSCEKEISKEKVTFRFRKDSNQFYISSVEIWNAPKKIDLIYQNKVRLNLGIIDSGLVINNRKAFHYYICLKGDMLNEDGIFYIISPDFGIIYRASLLWNNHLILNYFENDRNTFLIGGLYSQAKDKLLDHFFRSQKAELSLTEPNSLSPS